jgi:putative hydrolase of the HAD superfamily
VLIDFRRARPLRLSLRMDTCIYTDADNTLWDTDAVFREAQLGLLGEVETQCERTTRRSDRLEFVREYDQAIAARHHARLRYPPALLMRALRAGISGTSPDDAAVRVVAEGSVSTPAEQAALESYAKTLRSLPPILPTVREGLQRAQAADVPVYVVTEGPLDLARQRLASLQLDALTAGTLSAAKSRELYARLIQRSYPRRATMVGDQFDRDIQMARAAGMQTVLVQSRFRPAWTQDVSPEAADAIVDTFLQGIEWIIGRRRGDQT